MQRTPQAPPGIIEDASTPGDNNKWALIKELCEQMNISVSELARRIGQTPQNFNKKLKRETVTLDELKAIADVLGVRFEQAFVLPDGDEIKISNE